MNVVQQANTTNNLTSLGFFSENHLFNFDRNKTLNNEPSKRVRKASSKIHTQHTRVRLNTQSKTQYRQPYKNTHHNTSRNYLSEPVQGLVVIMRNKLKEEIIAGKRAMQREIPEGVERMPDWIASKAPGPV